MQRLDFHLYEIKNSPFLINYTTLKSFNIAFLYLSCLLYIDHAILRLLDTESEKKHGDLFFFFFF